MPEPLTVETGYQRPSDSEASTESTPTIKRKPLPPAAAVRKDKRKSVFLGTDMHPVIRAGESGNNTQSESPTKSPQVSQLINDNSPEHNETSSSTSATNFVYGDQLFHKVIYSEDQDIEVWRNDGDAIICIGKSVEMRIHSSTILKSRHQALIDRLQELNDSDSADFTEAAPYSAVPIRYILELPEPVRSDPITYCTSVRNFFAALRNKPIAGEDLVAELDQLHWTAVDLLGAQNHRDRAVKFVRKYVQKLKLDDCRYMRSDAIRLLSWCERTKWEKGWIECFAHCVGMMGSGIEECEAFSELSERTRKLLYSSSRMQQHEITAMEGVFSSFNVAGNATPADLDHAGGLRAARAFQQFLQNYYTEKFGSWPPEADSVTGRWLTRTIAQTLQEDFGGLYDLLVDNSVIQIMDGSIMDGSMPYLLSINDDETLTPLETGYQGSQFPLQKVLSNWNFKCGFEPIPHPWPILPRLRGTSPVNDPLSSKISLVSAVRERDVDTVEEQKDLRRAYLQGTHPEVQPSHFARAFLEHEAATRLKGVNTQDARLGRWLVVMCMMQLLSRIAVDIQGLWYTNGVPYFLNANIDRCPPWAGAKIPHWIRPSSFEDSWCWIYAKGVADLRRRSPVMAAENDRIPFPRFRVLWDDEGRWELKPLKRRISPSAM